MTLPPIGSDQAQALIAGASALFALVLVFVTAYYAWETRKHTIEMRRSRKPVLKINLVEYNGIHARLTLENVGQGTARNIEASWSFTDSDLTETFNAIQLDQGDRYMINRLPFEGDIKTFSAVEMELEDRDGKLETQIEYEDEFGEECCTCDVLDIKSAVDSRMNMEMPESSETDVIERSLDDIADAIKSK